MSNLTKVDQINLTAIKAVNVLKLRVKVSQLNLDKNK